LGKVVFQKVVFGNPVGAMPSHTFNNNYFTALFESSKPKVLGFIKKGFIKGIYKPKNLSIFQFA